MTPYQTVRNPVLSLFQSAAEAVARQRGGAAHPLPAAATHVAVARQNPASASAPPAFAAAALSCAELGLQLTEALLAGDAAKKTELRNRLSFSDCDPLWAETLVRYVALLQPDGKPRPIPYIHYAALSDFVIEAPRPDLRVALFSDWGTGTEEARQVAALMARQKPDIAIHLGDIYYSGTAEECTAHFLAPLQAALPGVRLFSLCGNHDVYSGGAGYYGLLRQIGQPASYFCLRSPDRAWQILAADTGLHDRNPFGETTAVTHLEPTEVAWHVDKLRGFAGTTVFLTHHEPFSAFRQIGPAAQHDPTNPALMASYAQFAAAGRIDAWFWGHDHRLQLYAPYRGVTAGRNIGFGAIPVAPGSEVPPPGLIDPPALAVNLSLDVVDGVYTHGFVVLDITGGAVEASYWTLSRPDGPIYQEGFGGGVWAT